MDRCPTCLMPAGFAGVKDSQSCLLCQDDDGPISYRGEDKLQQLLDKHRRIARERGSKYDVLVPVSGGKDSTYALYKLVRQYGMRVLAFNYRHGYVDATAAENLDKAVRRLGVDLEVNSDNRRQLNYLRHNLPLLLRQRRWRLHRLAALLCVGCNDGYVAGATKVANKYGISLISLPA